MGAHIEIESSPTRGGLAEVPFIRQKLFVSVCVR